ncbi:hypothetical protein [Burkholderia catarinensis]|uniref:hypothetical protein n=1 Tax=Burkholderia catarinensis TaxID=1108140 RepID=UPI000918D7F4|nr:hypothetical protein [Burkholderia catarinensis]KAG8154077.1 hypothetical protein BFF94_008685 [Burkholderia catarinensis]
MKNTVRIPISVLTLMLVAPVFANTPADNIAWSAKSVQTVASPSACSAYSGRVASSGEPLSTESVLKALGTSLAGAALGAVAGGYQGAAPNPCPRPGL